MATARFGSTSTGPLKWTLPQPIQSTTFPLKGQIPPTPPPSKPPKPVPTKPAPTPEPTMELPAQVYLIADDFRTAYPPPRRGPDETPGQHEERCRQWSIRLAKQVKHDTGEAKWGVKKKDRTSPISKDSLAFDGNDGLHSWDMLIGAGTGNPTFATNPAHHYIPAQVFVAVEPQDYLAPTQQVPTPPPVPVPPPPPPVPAPAVSYSQFVAVEAQQVRDKYRAVHGRDPAPSDLYHNAWRRLVEGWSHQAILDDIR